MISCQILAKKTLEKLHAFTKGHSLKLALLYSNEYIDSKSYAKIIKKTATEIEIDVVEHLISQDSLQDDVVSLINDLNYDKKVHGIILLAPLPKQIKFDELVNMIVPQKDVDLLNDVSSGSSYSKPFSKVLAATPKAVVHFLEENHILQKGMIITIVGAGKIVGKPLTSYLLDREVTVISCNQYTQNLEKLTKQAEVVVSAAGVAHLLSRDHFHEDSIVVDVGINMLNNKLVGDINYDEVSNYVKYITKVPGGIGNLTTAMLLDNLVTLYKEDTNDTTL